MARELRNLLIIARHEYKVVLRRRVFQITTAVVPLIIVIGLVVAWFIQQQDESDVAGKPDKVGYVDGTALFTDFHRQRGLQFVQYVTRSEGMDALLMEETKRLYVIPESYLETGVVERFEVSLGFDLDSSGDRALREFLLDNLSVVGAPSKVLDRLKDPFFLQAINVDSAGVPQTIDSARVVFFLAVAGILFFAMVFSGSILIQGLGEEKESRVLEVMLSAVTPSQLMIGKVVGLGAAGLSQILVWAVSGVVGIRLLAAITSDIPFSLPGTAAALLAVPFFVLGYLFYATLLSGLGAATTTPRESQQLSIIFTAPLIVPVYAWIYIVENPTAAIVRFLSFFPFTAPSTVLMRIGADAIPAWEIAASLLVLAASVAAVLTLVPRVFRAFILSYGRRPGLRVLWRALSNG